MNELSISLTENAAKRVTSLLKSKGIPDGSLRIFVAGGGCSGWQYGMAIASSPEEDDIILNKLGVSIVVDPESAPNLNGVEIDFVEDIMKSGFSIFNPNATKSCACGSSFQTADGSGQARSCC